MKEQLNCPNCGMPITGTQCEYCGTLFYDFATLDCDKPTYVRVKWQDQILAFQAAVRDFGITLSSDPITYYADNNPVYIPNNNMTVNLTMESLPDDRGVLLERRKIKK